MIDHVTLAVSDLEKSKLFYQKAFASLGYDISFGSEGSFWAFDIGDGLFEIQRWESAPPLTRVHVAFRVKSKAQGRCVSSRRVGSRRSGQWRSRPWPRIQRELLRVFCAGP